jgi:hypothetical protein
MALVAVETVMKWTGTIPSLVLVMLISLACHGPGSSRIRREWPQLIDRARARVLAELPNLDDASRETVQTNDPKLLVVRVPFGADYRYVWTISSNRTVELWANNDYRKLDNARVRIRPSSPD